MSKPSVSYQFKPDLLNPAYFIRKGLYKAMLDFCGELHGRLMDFGCGSKPYKNLFSVDEYIGVDFENEGHAHEQEQIDVFYDGKKLPFEDETFDSVLCSEVFEHVFNLEEVLTEITRVMKKDGLILITCPFVWNEHEVPNDFARYTRFALQDILSRHGFEIVRYAKSGHFVSTVVQLWVLYFNILLYKRTQRYFPLRWIYKFFFVLVPNIIGYFLVVLLPKNDSLYMNNIVLAKNKSGNARQ